MKTAEDILAHYGIPGMKWGVRRSRDSSTGRVGTSEDAAKASEYRKQAKKSGVSTLSNAQLSDLNRRLELESKYRKFASANPSLKKKALDFITQELVKEGMKELGVAEKGSDFSQVAKVIKDSLSKKSSPKPTTRATVQPQPRTARKARRKDPVFTVTDLGDRRLPARR